MTKILNRQAIRHPEQRATFARVSKDALFRGQRKSGRFGATEFPPYPIARRTASSTTSVRATLACRFGIRFHASRAAIL